MNNLPPANPPAPNDYSFLNQTGQAPKKSLLPSPKTKKGRLTLFLGGFSLLIVIFLVTAAVLNNIDAAKRAEWLKLAQKQQEIIRLSEIGIKEAELPEAKNLATNTKLTLLSSQQDINNLVKKAGAKLSTKNLGAAENEDTTKSLENAKQNNLFDSAFRSVLKKELIEYQVMLKKLSDVSKNQNTKALLESAYQNAEILVSQASQ